MTNIDGTINDINELICEFSNSTDLASVFVDVQGNEISDRFNFSAFCEKIREDSQYFEICKNCDRLGGIKALKDRSVRCYTCHAGLVDFSVPVVQKGNLIGFIQCGQAKIANTTIPHIEHARNSIFGRSKDLQLLHNQIKPVSMEKIHCSAKLISRLVNNDIYKIINSIDEEELLYSDQICAIESLKYKYHIDEAQLFVRRNLHNYISLDSVSIHLNISPQYFCRIFKQHMGVGFSQYVNEQRINYANNLLCEGKMSIEEVAKSSGFASSSYFIKQFKKHCNITPREYRESIKIKRKDPVHDFV